MALPAEINVLTPTGPVAIRVAAASSVVFIGANGAGKTRLGVFLGSNLSADGVEVHRIAAHRSLTLNPNVVPPSLKVASKSNATRSVCGLMAGAILPRTMLHA